MLIADPFDLDGYAAALGQLLDDPQLAARLGAAAHQRVLDEYLGDRHLAQYVDLFASLVAAGPTDTSAR